MILFNKASKTNWLAVIIGLLATAASAFLLFRKDVKDATDAQNDFNKAIQDGNDILANNKPIEERYKILSTLNRRQVEQLKDDINSQIKAEEDYTALLLSELQKRFDADKVLNDYKKEQTKSKNIFDRAWYQNQIDLRKKELAQELEAENKKHSQSKRMLENYLNGVNSMLKNMPADDPIPGSTKSFDEQIKALDEANKQKRLLLLQSYNQLKIDKQELDSELLNLETAYLIAKTAIYKANNKDIIDLQVELANKEKELWDNVTKYQEDYNTKYFEKIIKEKEKATEDHFKKNEDDLDKWMNHLEKELDNEDILRAKAIDKRKEELEQNKAITDTFAASMGEALGIFISNNQASSEEFAKAMIMAMLDTLHSIIRMSIASIWAQSLAQPDSIKTYGLAGIARAAIISALVEAAFAAVKSVVSNSMSQRFSGKYDVIGADDGKTYKNLPVGGNPKTGIYGTPTIMFERGDELIVDHSTLNNLRLNFPHVLPTIRAAMVPQRASGNVSALNVPTPAADPELKLILKQQAAVINALSSTLKKGLTADISYSRAKERLDKGAAAENRASRTP